MICDHCNKNEAIVLVCFTVWNSLDEQSDSHEADRNLCKSCLTWARNFFDLPDPKEKDDRP